MKNLVLLVAGVVVLGCGKQAPQTQPEVKSHPEKPPLPKVFTNTLGMKFVPVPGTKVQFCIWETRVKDYAAYAAANKGVDDSWENFGYGFTQTEAHPVVRVAWNEANDFCAWLTKKELADGGINKGEKYRLPTDEEWSMAVGLGKEKGNTPKEKDNWFGDKYPWGTKWPPPKGVVNLYQSLNIDNFKHTSPVGSFPPNKYFIFDLGGNVSEWCQDVYDPNARVLFNLPRPRVNRGGNHFMGNSQLFKSATRLWISPGYRAHSLGFRCVLASE